MIRSNQRYKVMQNFDRNSTKQTLSTVLSSGTNRSTKVVYSIFRCTSLTPNNWLSFKCIRRLQSHIEQFKTTFWVSWYQGDLLLLNAMPSVGSTPSVAQICLHSNSKPSSINIQSLVLTFSY